MIHELTPKVTSAPMSDMLQEPLIKYSTRSVEVNVARPFKAGERSPKYLRRLATPEMGQTVNRRDATSTANDVIPALKGRAKLQRLYASNT